MILWCRACGKPSSIRLWICPACFVSPANWADDSPEPVPAYVLTRNDWAFLKAGKIDPQIERPEWIPKRA